MKKNIYLPLMFLILTFISCEIVDTKVNPFYGDVVGKLRDAIEYEIKDKNLNAISIAIIKKDDFFWS